MNKIYQFIAIFLGILILIFLFSRMTEPFTDPKTAYKEDTEYKAQVKMLTDRYVPTAYARRNVSTLLDTNIMPEDHQNFINFFSLGCRYAGYLGPMNNGYFDADIGIQLAVAAGCRTFVLDIDYIEHCNNYYPIIAVRDVKGRLLMKDAGNYPICQSEGNSNLADVCKKINLHAFSSATQNSSDPLIIVLYFQSKPPGSYKSTEVLDYYSKVAKCLSPFKDRIITSEVNGGSFYRQKQEGILLINNISNYYERVLIFSNANTSGFREVKNYSNDADLDFWVNLRLNYTQSQLGITENATGPSFGILQTIDDFTTIPIDRNDSIIETQKLRWTICLSRDPSIPLTPEIYEKVTNTYGVNCVPIQIFDIDNKYLYTDKLFKTYSFLPKPKAIRYLKPPVVTPAEPSPTTDAKGGMLRSPTS
jgi:hypothetical protein